MATKKETKKQQPAPKAAPDADKAAKRKARMEALKNRPKEQRTNSKQIDIIDFGNGHVIKNFGYPLKNKEGHQGVLVTSVTFNGEVPVSSSVAFVPGNFTVKAKKGHGTITGPKVKGEKEEADEAGDAED